MSEQTTPAAPAQDKPKPPPSQKVPNAPGDDLIPARDMPIAMGERGLVLKTNREAWRIANAMLAGRMVPKSYTTAPQIYTAILAGAELGLSPGASVRSIAVINGTPSLWGTGGYAIAMKSEHYDRHEITWQLPGEEETDIEPEFDVPDRNKDGEYDVEPLTLIPNGFRCICRAYRKDVVKPFVAKFSVADAKRAGLWGRTSKTGEAMPWSNYPARMLMHKAVGNALEAAFPGAYMGLTSASDAELPTKVVDDEQPTPGGIDYPAEPITLRRTDDEAIDASFTVNTEPTPEPVKEPEPPKPPEQPEKVRKPRKAKEQPQDNEPGPGHQAEPTTTEPVVEQPPAPEPVAEEPKAPTSKEIMREFNQARPEHIAVKHTTKDDKGFMNCDCGARFEVNVVGSVITFPEVKKGDGSCSPPPAAETKQPEPVKPPTSAVDPRTPPPIPKNGMSQTGQAFLKDMWESTSKGDLGETWAILVRRLNSSKNEDSKLETQVLVENCIRRRLDLDHTVNGITTVAGWINEVKARMLPDRVEVLRDLLKLLQQPSK